MAECVAPLAEILQSAKDCVVDLIPGSPRCKDRLDENEEVDRVCDQLHLLP